MSQRRAGSLLLQLQWSLQTSLQQPSAAAWNQALLHSSSSCTRLPASHAARWSSWAATHWRSCSWQPQLQQQSLAALRQQAWRGLATQRSALSTAAADAAAAQGAAAATAAAAGRQLVSRSSPLAAHIPDAARRQMAWWLAGCSGWVFSMVVLGGVTRLTRSGLSMTEWKFTGEKMPRSQADWEAEFTKYRASPEFRLAHAHMTLEDFKFIFWMEYAHRMWGRLLGVVFAVPAAVFAARGVIPRPLASRLGLLFFMGGTQGLVGWWMVRSGLQEPDNPHYVPRVSPYRLAGHLTSAFAIYATLVWTTASLFQPAPLAAAAGAAAQTGAALLRSRVLPLAALIGVTAISGAFVAGLDAGHAYNTFPTMNGAWVPEEYWDIPGWRNAFENTAAVQLHHRALALTTLAAVGGVWLSARRLALPSAARTLLNATAAVTAAQVALGITTLLTYVPVELGAAHQAGALTLFTTTLLLAHTLQPMLPPASAALLARWLTPAVVAATCAVAVGVTQQV